jgi:hypothetical protein
MLALDQVVTVNGGFLGHVKGVGQKEAQEFWLLILFENLVKW